MGIYINPKNVSKEEWLETYGVREFGNLTETVDFVAYFPVVLVDTGLFTAAAVADSENEYLRFNQPGDSRSKKVYIVSIERLKDVLDAFSLKQLGA